MTNPTHRKFVQSIGTGGAAFAAFPVFAPGRVFAGTGVAANEPAAQSATVLLNYNENAYGPSPRAQAAIRDADAAVVSRYFPEDTYDTLRDALAAHHGVTRAHIRVAVGSTEILKVCDDIFLAGGAPLVVAEPAYEAVIQYAANSRAKTTKVPLTADHRHDLPRMASATSAATGLVYICNPNNPTGTIVRRDEIAAFIQRMPPSVTVLVDEAYAEFVEDPGYESAVRYVREGRNVIVAKTFSKIHGLAGMRVGYAIAKPELIARIAPFTVDFATTGASANAAMASLGDTEHRATVARRNAAQRSVFVNEMRSLGFSCTESHANFVMVDIRRPVGPVIAALAKQRVLVGREFGAMPTFLRVTLGTEPEMRAFYAAFREVIKA
ncbi:MAG: aminotransferase class I/II-fold pyridoxal phosphate-dependent enzyme [Gemmatimonadetes bacterium]|nr:aminotransferase class I/II-fold pyridoxal phosphate-dependent enzyme [Gemmatimonadota bacterium]